MGLPSPRHEIQPFAGLDWEKALGLVRPHRLDLIVSGDDVDYFRQLFYIRDYLSHPDLGCQSVLLEYPYIDRDYMEDHSIFYSRNLRSYQNFCKRLHFFNLPAADLEKAMRNILNNIENDFVSRRESYDSKCRKFSAASYLGFATVKPLPGCPVGRTVLRTYNRKTDGSTRLYPCTRDYTAHVVGVTLTVTGLAFQQQDLGVSACATTALWSSLQMVKSHEDAGTSSPAQITTFASRDTLPFGRPMPSEGLSIEQMCLAVQSTGVAPMLMNAIDFENTLAGIYSATTSGFAPVLILEDGTTNPDYHAVTVAGVKIKDSVPRAKRLGSRDSQVSEVAARSEALYIHDDRHGPYLRALIKKDRSNLLLEIDPSRDGSGAENWIVTHVLIPVHPKIRLSFGNLRSIAIALCIDLNGMRKGIKESPNTDLSLEYRIVKSFKYAEELALHSANCDINKLSQFHSTFLLPRYLGVITMSAPTFGKIDVLVDTTSTITNLDFVGLVGTNICGDGKILLGQLSHECQCPFII